MGYRPFVYRLAQQYCIAGTVSNGCNGVHIDAWATDPSVLHSFVQQLLDQPPPHSLVTAVEQYDLPGIPPAAFSIIESDPTADVDLLIPPDLGICAACRAEIADREDRRYHYAFITCIHCGPRYSIITRLPYDRSNTSMQAFAQCETCLAEYTHPFNRRYYSQTNSCSACGITMQVYDSNGKEVVCTQNEVVEQVAAQLLQGHIAAVKGTGGFLLLCDAANVQSVSLLRTRKQRPSKPFALLYLNLAAAEADFHLGDAEKDMLQTVQSPIVLCRYKPHVANTLALQQLAPGLNRLGIMLPYTPLLHLIVQAVGRPVVATSGNLSGSPIVYTNEEAIDALTAFADLVVVNNRDIVAPQDDSVLQFSRKHALPILLRRSRGWAPTVHPTHLPETNTTLLAMGAELKSAFGIAHKGRCYVSQYLGDQSYYEAQQSYRHTLHHLLQLLQVQPQHILADAHPGYECSRLGQQLAEEQGLPITMVQHHEAHIAAVMAENDLLHTNGRVLGALWDGTGYGHDGQIWGGEFFLYENYTLQRCAHLAYFPVLLGDKMSRQPRLSALALCHSIPGAADLLRSTFTDTEWNLYTRMLQGPATLHASSMGRLLDGIACLLSLASVSHYEGEAAMLLQATAERCHQPSGSLYPLTVHGSIIDWKPMLRAIVHDLKRQVPVETIAYTVHASLAALPAQLADLHQATAIACSGGVWQNSLLADMLVDSVQGKFPLHFHRQLSPNDECIAYGQLAWYNIQCLKDEQGPEKPKERTNFSATTEFTT